MRKIPFGGERLRRLHGHRQHGRLLQGGACEHRETRRGAGRRAARHARHRAGVLRKEHQIHGLRRHPAQRHLPDFGQLGAHLPSHRHHRIRQVDRRRLRGPRLDRSRQRSGALRPDVSGARPRNRDHHPDARHDPDARIRNRLPQEARLRSRLQEDGVLDQQGALGHVDRRQGDAPFRADAARRGLSEPDHRIGRGAAENHLRAGRNRRRERQALRRQGRGHPRRGGRRLEVRHRPRHAHRRHDHRHQGPRRLRSRRPDPHHRRAQDARKAHPDQVADLLEGAGRQLVRHVPPRGAVPRTGDARHRSHARLVTAQRHGHRRTDPASLQLHARGRRFDLRPDEDRLRRIRRGEQGVDGRRREGLHEDPRQPDQNLPQRPETQRK